LKLASSQGLIDKINQRKAVVGVIGLGYVGLPLVLEFCKAGFSVIGFDIDIKKVEMLHQAKSYIKHLDVSALQGATKFRATTDFSELIDVDCILICVPTPLNRNREPDLSYVFNTTLVIAKYLRQGQLISLESTTYPGTTDEDMLEILDKSGLHAGEDYFLAYSPEREDPNNHDFSTATIPKIVGGFTPKCLSVANALYSSIVKETVPVSSTKIAEAAKLLENIYRSVNIALVNELKMLFDKMGIDIWEVINAAKTKPFGFMPFYPGPGLGGHCIPIDPFYLTWKARQYDMTTKFIELAGEINVSMPYYVVHRLMEALNEKGKSLKGSKILILGLAYKKDIDDIRESPSLKLMEILMEKGADVSYNDPYIPKIPKMRMYNIEKSSVELTADTLSNADCVLISTDHTVYSPEFIAKHAPLIVDTRNVMKGINNRENIMKA
jgi:UDP-N-acetyl-D-glucosamine dehydrogenase